jgi:hypothetical protein
VLQEGRQVPSSARRGQRGGRTAKGAESCTQTVLPDFHLYNIPKRNKYTRRLQNLLNGLKPGRQGTRQKRYSR